MTFYEIQCENPNIWNVKYIYLWYLIIILFGFKKKTKTQPNTKFFHIFNGRNNKKPATWFKNNFLIPGSDSEQRIKIIASWNDKQNQTEI